MDCILQQMRKDASSTISAYIESLAATDDVGLRSVETRLRAAGKWGINIGVNEGRLLSCLVKMAGVRRAVEIGALYGYSAVWIARALPTEGRLWTIERDPDNARASRQSFSDCGVTERVTLLEGDASAKLAELSAVAPFDLVFIDANKSAYLEYLDWAEANLRSGGLLIADNVFLGGGVCLDEKPANLSLKQWQGMREFNRRLMTGGGFTSAVVPTAEGLLVAVRG